MLNEKAKTVANFFSEFNEIMMKMTMIVMKAAPVGVFCLIATTFSNYWLECLCSNAKIYICSNVSISNYNA